MLILMLTSVVLSLLSQLVVCISLSAAVSKPSHHGHHRRSVDESGADALLRLPSGFSMAQTCSGFGQIHESRLSINDLKIKYDWYQVETHDVTIDKAGPCLSTWRKNAGGRYLFSSVITKVSGTPPDTPFLSVLAFEGEDLKLTLCHVVLQFGVSQTATQFTCLKPKEPSKTVDTMGEAWPKSLRFKRLVCKNVATANDKIIPEIGIEFEDIMKYPLSTGREFQFESNWRAQPSSQRYEAEIMDNPACANKKAQIWKLAGTRNLAHQGDVTFFVLDTSNSIHPPNHSSTSLILCSAWYMEHGFKLPKNYRDQACTIEH